MDRLNGFILACKNSNFWYNFDTKETITNDELTPENLAALEEMDLKRYIPYGHGLCIALTLFEDMLPKL